MTITTELTKNYVNSTEHIKKVNTKFGILDIDVNNSFNFIDSPLGINNAYKFCLINVTKEDQPSFKLFQCVENNKIGFIVLASNQSISYIKNEQIENICSNLNIERENLKILLIINPNNSNNKNINPTINLKAPIVLDLKTRNAFQYVIDNDNYLVNQPLN